jgi:hypothetical protein
MLIVTTWVLMAIAAVVIRTASLTTPVTAAEALGWVFLACAPGAAFFFIARRLTAPSTAALLRDGTHLDDRRVAPTVGGRRR